MRGFAGSTGATVLDGQLEPGEIWSVIDSGSALEEEGKKEDGDVGQHLCLLQLPAQLMPQH